MTKSKIMFWEDLANRGKITYTELARIIKEVQDQKERRKEDN